MLLLASSNFPTSSGEAVEALRGGFESLQITAPAIQVEGTWPALTSLTIDLTGAHLNRSVRLPEGSADAVPAFTAEHFVLCATPLHLETTPLHLDLRVQSASFAIGRDSARRQVLQLSHAAGGSLRLQATREDLERMLKTLAAEVASKQGADVKSARLEFTSQTPQSLTFRAEITAKVFIMTAKVVVTGQLEIDERLDLRLRNLATSGEGMLASLASGYLRPRFAALEKETIPLGQFTFAGLKLKHVRLTGGDALRLEADVAA